MRSRVDNFLADLGSGQAAAQVLGRLLQAARSDGRGKSLGHLGHRNHIGHPLAQGAGCPRGWPRRRRRLLQQAHLPFLALTQLNGLQSIIFGLQGLESIGHRTELFLQLAGLVRPSAGFQGADSLIEMLKAMAVVTGLDGQPVAHQCQEPCEADLHKFQPVAGRKPPTDLLLAVGVGLGVGLEHAVDSV